MATSKKRTTTEVLHDHLARRLDGDLEGDLAENFSEDVLLLTGFATYRGHDGVRASAAQLREAVGDRGSFVYSRTVIEDDYAFLEWQGRDEKTVVSDGADSFHIVDGKIVMQTIHYTAWPRD